MTQERFDLKIARLAARQHGVVSRNQVLRLGGTRGLIDARLRSRRWERLHAGVYRVTGAPPSWRQSLMATCLACGSGAAVSHRAAAALWGLLGFKEGAVEVSVPRLRGRRRGITVHRVQMLPSIDITIVDGIPVTTPARTLIDLAAKESPRIVEEALDDALRRGLVSRVRLRWRIDELGRRGRPGIDVIRSLVAARTPGTSVPQSVFETRLLRLLREAGLPAPALQHEVKTAGRLLAVVDFAFPDLRLAVEADGYRWHSGRASWEHDRARRNALTSAGWKVVHVTWNDLNHRAPETVAGIKAAIVRSAEEHGGMGSLRC